jgi:DNA sulfur modification protein DndB
VVEAIPLFRDFTDLERTSISNRALKMFTLSSLHQGTMALLRNQPSEPETQKKLAIEFWNQVISNMQDWQHVAARKILPSELRPDYVHAHGLAVQAIGIAGSNLLDARPNDWQKALNRLSAIDWSRSNRSWEGRAMVAGKLNKSRNNVLLVSNLILTTMGVPLTEEGRRVEQRFDPKGSLQSIKLHKSVG